VLHLTLGSAVGVASIVALAALAIRFLVAGLRASRLHAVLLGLALFVAGTAFLTGLGRLGLSEDQALASRYATPVLLFWLAVIGLALDGLARARPNWRAAASVGFVAGLAASLVLVVLLHIRHGRNIRELAQEVDYAGLAPVVGVADAAALRRLYTLSANRVLAEADYLKQHRLGPFHGSEAAWLGRDIGEIFDPAPSERCTGAIVDVAAAATSPSAGAEPLQGFRIAGWVADLDARRPPSFVLITDPNGTVAGLAKLQQRRLAVVESIFGRTGHRHRWRGFTRAVAGDGYAAYALLADGRICRLAG